MPVELVAGGDIVAAREEWEQRIGGIRTAFGATRDPTADDPCRAVAVECGCYDSAASAPTCAWPCDSFTVLERLGAAACEAEHLFYSVTCRGGGNGPAEGRGRLEGGELQGAPTGLSEEEAAGVLNLDEAGFYGTASAEQERLPAPRSVAVRTDCADRTADCVGWAAQGECDRNAGYMDAACPRSCGLCVHAPGVKAMAQHATAVCKALRAAGPVVIGRDWGGLSVAQIREWRHHACDAVLRPAAEEDPADRARALPAMWRPAPVQFDGVALEARDPGLRAFLAATGQRLSVLDMMLMWGRLTAAEKVRWQAADAVTAGRHAELDAWGERDRG
jgi:hypothetical protein